MQPQLRQVPPSVGCRSTTAVFAAGRGANCGNVAAATRADDDEIVLDQANAQPSVLAEVVISVARKEGRS